MPSETRTVRFAAAPKTVIDEDGTRLIVPDDWALLHPGDAGMTRRVKAAGPSWTVTEKVGRRVFSHGVYAPSVNIVAARAELETERADPSYARKLEAARGKREKVQERYVETFHETVLRYLAFHPSHADLADRLASAVTTHATPVGSGTVARTERIPVEERAEAAVIAWMRHQTTAYDNLVIPKIAGERRRVRRMLAEHSKRLLDVYRRESAPSPGCPLARALDAKVRS